MSILGWSASAACFWTIAAIGTHVLATPESMLSLAAILAGTTGYVVLANAWAFTRCPRCFAPFHYRQGVMLRPLRRHCVHCALPRGFVPDADRRVEGTRHEAREHGNGA